MIAPNIEIPPGLEEAYFGAVALLGGVNPNTIMSRKGSPAKKNFARVFSRSLFVIWESIWDSFDSTRKTAWTNYWITLPFGSHSGSSGWPGSGYSAFVYFNAPRYRDGLDLILDPPTNLLLNGSFDGFVPWFWGEAWFYNTDKMSVDEATDWGLSAYLTQDVTVEDSVSYHVSFKIRFNPLNLEGTGDSSVDIAIGLGNDGALQITVPGLHYSDADYHTLEYDIVADVNPFAEEPHFDFYFTFGDFLEGTTLDVTDFVLTLNP
jgi:hypothetical protein